MPEDQHTDCSRTTVFLVKSFSSSLHKIWLWRHFWGLSAYPDFSFKKLFFRGPPGQKNVTNHLTFPAMHGVRQEPVPDALCAAAGGAVCTTGA